MTRMAPRPSRIAIREPSLRSVVVRWRVGLRGSLVLSLSMDGFDGAIRGEALLADAMAPGSQTSYPLEGHLSFGSQEATMELTLPTDKGERKASVTLLASGNVPMDGLVVLTDLPVVLGLRGGTYVVDDVRVDDVRVDGELRR